MSKAIFALVIIAMNSLAQGNSGVDILRHAAPEDRTMATHHNLGAPTCPGTCCDADDCKSCGEQSGCTCASIIGLVNLLNPNPCILKLLCAIDCLNPGKATGATDGVCILTVPC